MDAITEALIARFERNEARVRKLEALAGIDAGEDPETVPEPKLSATAGERIAATDRRVAARERTLKSPERHAQRQAARAQRQEAARAFRETA